MRRYLVVASQTLLGEPLLARAQGCLCDQAVARAAA